ncbi:MAG: hypothetical protein V7L23_34965 [Nostoc sp.]|uniref:hypothetical protein n=1 Tax=Nostoc sp. TaxID=1180 RepID=UPI002FEE6DA8
MPYSNAPEIVDGAALGDNTTLKFLNIAVNISTDLLTQYFCTWVFALPEVKRNLFFSGGG